MKNIRNLALGGLILALTAADTSTATAGDQEWATVGKVLTGLAIASAVHHGGHVSVTIGHPPPPVYVAPRPVVIARPPVCVAPAPVVVRHRPPVFCPPPRVVRRPIVVQPPVIVHRPVVIGRPRHVVIAHEERGHRHRHHRDDD